MEIALSPAARDALAPVAAAPGAAVFASIRRFDLAELEVAVSQEDGAMAMMGLRIPQALFAFTLGGDGATLVVDVHRKELPVSKTFGGAAFVFVFHLVPTDEVLVTQAFFVASKEPPAKAPRAAPKRVRGPPPRQPTAGAAEGLEVALNAKLAALAGRPAPAATAVAVAAAPEPEPEAEGRPRALKRVRASTEEVDLFSALTPLMGFAPAPTPPQGPLPELALAPGGSPLGALALAETDADFAAFEAELVTMGFDAAGFDAAGFDAAGFAAEAFGQV
jgi:hypothetical protein